MTSLQRGCMLLAVLTPSIAAAAEPITLSALLEEMTDREVVARLPEPAYTCRQASSYDQASVGPEEPGWFANNDRSFFIRKETNGGREEWVLMDADGPGAIVRWWVTAPAYVGTIRVYLDGNDQPAIEAKVDDLVGGDFLVGPPLSAERARGRNLYLPIPYAKSCKVTFDRPNFQETGDRNDLLYYQINYRTYEPGTQVESFTMEGLEAVKEQVDKVQKQLVSDTAKAKTPSGGGLGKLSNERIPGEATTSRTHAVLETELQVEGDQGCQLTLDGPMAVRRLQVNLKAENMPQALRSTYLKMEFDGEQTVWCPVGDFFGSGVGVNPFKDWWRQVHEDGTMVCYYPMPFEKSCRITVANLHMKAVKCRVVAEAVPWLWDSRSMHFHAHWRQEREIETQNGGQAALDWNYITIEGCGLFVGDTLSVVNRVPGWWGEGDEKIFVDGEAFPSHFGTGTEDYYGYAWCTPEFFESPFHAQPRAEGPRNYGNTTNSRVRMLDAIPFQKSLHFDMEVWHWAATTIDYAVATYWYARPGATCNIEPQPEEAKAPVAYDTPPFVAFPGFKIAKYPSGDLRMQGLSQFDGGTWRDDDHLWWTGAQPGDRLELTVAVEKAGPYDVIVELTKARDYGVVQFHIDGKQLGEPVDLYHPEVIPTGPITLGTADLSAGEHTLTVEIMGKNEKAVPSYMFGIDRYELKAAE